MNIAYNCRSSFEDRFQIEVQDIRGGRHRIDCYASDTIDKIKSAIQDKAGFQQDQQKLMFKKTELEDGYTLSDYKIPPKAVLQITGVKIGFAG